MIQSVLWQCRLGYRKGIRLVKTSASKPLWMAITVKTMSYSPNCLVGNSVPSFTEEACPWKMTVKMNKWWVCERLWVRCVYSHSVVDSVNLPVRWIVLVTDELWYWWLTSRTFVFLLFLLQKHQFLADRTATQYDRLLPAGFCPSVCLSVCLFTYC